MFSYIKTFLISLTATAFLSTPAVSAGGSQAKIMFAGFLGDGAVYSTYGYSRQTRHVYASFHVELPGLDKPLDVTRKLPSGGEEEFAEIRGLYSQAYEEVSDILSRHGGVKKGFQTFESENKDHEGAATDAFGNTVEIKSEPSSIRECEHQILNDGDYISVQLNEKTLTIFLDDKLCLTQGFVTGMWSKTEGAPATVASFLFLSEDGDQHVFLVHDRPKKGLFSKISYALD